MMSACNAIPLTRAVSSPRAKQRGAASASPARAAAIAEFQSFSTSQSERHSFTPKITERAAAKRSQFLEGVDRWHEVDQDRAQQYAQLSERHETRDCTFQPNVSSSSPGRTTKPARSRAEHASGAGKRSSD